MKKAAMLFTAAVLFASFTFAQTPQPQDKAAKPAEKKECTKEVKSGCDHKTKAACAHSKDAKGCCAKDAKKPAPTTSTPEKK